MSEQTYLPCLLRVELFQGGGQGVRGVTSQCVESSGGLCTCMCGNPEMKYDCLQVLERLVKKFLSAYCPQHIFLTE